MLGRPQQHVIAAVDVEPGPGEDVHPLLVVVEQRQVDVDAITGPALLDIGQVALDREVRAARGQIGGVDAHEAHERIDPVARQLQVPAVVGVAVVVHPLRGHDPLDHPQRTAVVQLLPADSGSSNSLRSYSSSTSPAPTPTLRRPCSTATSAPSRCASSSRTVRPAAWASDWVTMRSSSSSVSSGTSTNRLHGHCSAGRTGP